MLVAHLLLALTATSADLSPKYLVMTNALRIKGMNEQGAYKMLAELTTQVGPRLSGSENDMKAVDWGLAKMRQLGFQNVHPQRAMVPHWVRGGAESCSIPGPMGKPMALNCTALGFSAGTPPEGVTAEVIEVKSVDEAKALGDRAKGKIVFYSGPMPQAFVQSGGAYGAAGPQRFQGPSVAAKLGAVAVVLRSLSTMDDDEPHTGVTRFEDGVKPIPAAALGVQSALKLSAALKANPHAEMTLRLSSETLPDVPSANVIGEITGSEKPNEVIVMGGHLDSWDKGTGAHDDGAGVVHSLEALRLIKELGWKPKRTIRVVLFANEESMGRGADAYAAAAKTSTIEKAYAGIESDSGGFAPRGFSCSYDAKKIKKLNKWVPALSVFEAEKLTPGGGGGADVGPLGELGAVLFGLEPETQRYFDYHHSHNDTLDKVHPRELELGALAMATLAWLISEEGV